MDRNVIARRRFIGALLSGAAFAGPLRAAAVQPQIPAGAIDVVEAFGFVGDGRTDNYDAFHRLTAHANVHRGGSYNFPPGQYAVQRWHSLPTPRSGLGRSRPTGFVDCDGLSLTGYGARILLNGRFHRRAGSQYRDAVFLPFELKACRDVRVAGFEVDGGVRQMTRDPDAAETYAGLVSLLGCNRVTLEDLDLHHGQTDGVYLYVNPRPGRPGAVCRDITMRNVSCHDNARGGLAALQVLGLSCTDCDFSNNGTGDLGRYRPHAPQFGVCVEPDFLRASEIDARTGNLEFRRCRFNDNSSAFLAAYQPRYQGYLRLIDCSSSNRHGRDYHIIIAWKGAVVEGCRFDAGAGTIWTSWSEGQGADLTMRSCEIRTSAVYGVHNAHPGNRLTLDGVKIIGTHRNAPGHGFVLAVHGKPLSGQRHIVRNCEIFVPAARKDDSYNYDYEVSLHHALAENNVYRTDLSARGDRHFCTEYNHGTVVRGDRYRGSAPGPADSFRPGHNASHDTRLPFSRG